MPPVFKESNPAGLAADDGIRIIVYDSNISTDIYSWKRTITPVVVQMKFCLLVCSILNGVKMVIFRIYNY